MDGNCLCHALGYFAAQAQYVVRRTLALHAANWWAGHFPWGIGPDVMGLMGVTVTEGGDGETDTKRSTLASEDVHGVRTQLCERVHCVYLRERRKGLVALVYRGGGEHHDVKSNRRRKGDTARNSLGNAANQNGDAPHGTEQGPLRTTDGWMDLRRSLRRGTAPKAQIADADKHGTMTTNAGGSREAGILVLIQEHSWPGRDYQGYKRRPWATAGMEFIQRWPTATGGAVGQRF